MKAVNAFAALLDADAAPGKPAGKRAKAPAAAPAAPAAPAPPKPASAPASDDSAAGWTDSGHRRNRSGGGGSSNGGAPASAPALADASRAGARGAEAPEGREKKTGEASITSSSVEADASAAASSADARLQLVHSWAHAVRGHSVSPCLPTRAPN
jgi:hypothetical protein